MRGKRATFRSRRSHRGAPDALRSTVSWRVSGRVDHYARGPCFRRVLFVLLAAAAWLACGSSVDSALQSSIDKRVLSFKQFSDNVYDAPQSTEPLPLAVGQWASYKLMDKEGNPALVTRKVVGETGDAFWLETVRETHHDKQVTLLLVAMGNGKNLDDVDWRAMKQKVDDHSPTEFPGSVLSLMKALWKPMLENMVVDGCCSSSGPLAPRAKSEFEQPAYARTELSLQGSGEPPTFAQFVGDNRRAFRS
jgi:hypothetical protein